MLTCEALDRCDLIGRDWPQARRLDDDGKCANPRGSSTLDVSKTRIRYILNLSALYLRANEPFGQEAKQPTVILIRILGRGRVEHDVEHWDIALVKYGALQEEAHEGWVQSRLWRA